MKKYGYKLARVVGFFGLLLFGIFYSQVGVKAAEVIGYSNEQSNYDLNSGRWYDSNWDGQSFTASTTNITRFEFPWGSDYKASMTLRMVICEDPNLTSNNACDGKTVIYTEDFAISPTTNNEIINLVFSELVPLNIGIDYGIVFGSIDYPWYFSYRGNLGSDAWSGGQMLGVNKDGTNRDFWFHLYYDDTYSAANDYILYYGDNPYYQAIGQESALPVVYDVCDSWDSEHPFSLELRKSPYSSSDWISLDSYTLSSCSGTLLLNDISATTELSETAKLVIYNGETTIAESNEFLYVAYTPLSVNNDSFIHYYYPNGLYVDTSGGNGTTTINFAYDVCADDNFASSTFYLKNLDSGNTGVSFTPIQCNAAASLELPYTEDLQLAFPATISYQRNGVEYLKSNNFNIIFYSDASPLTMPEIEDYFGSNLFPLSECSSGNWWTESICKAGNYGIKTINFVAEQVPKMAKSSLNILKNIFPFNFANKFKESYELSATTELPTDLQFLEIGDGNGNLSMSFPKELTGSENDLSYVIWGPEAFAPSGSKSEDFFNHISILLKYLLWAGWIYGLWRLGERAYEELRSIDNNND